MLSDEEESGSTTSSCDETETGVVGADSDTTSAPSPTQHSAGKLNTLFERVLFNNYSQCLASKYDDVLSYLWEGCCSLYEVGSASYWPNAPPAFSTAVGQFFFPNYFTGKYYLNLSNSFIPIGIS